VSARISEHDREHMDEIMSGYGDWFSARLLRLIAKADIENRALLRQVFPDHVQTYEEWCLAPRSSVPE
jgi:hypothetical protein